MSNHLKNETSPYLLQHADNPVDWYPWGEVAFSRAAAEDKPVFLSVGYSTCHWCHVMAHESFENPGIAEILNRHFISVKVDREERPDIDSVYMAVCQALTGRGGWPMSVFLTPEKKPFFAGTYFAPQVFASLLERISSLWQENRTGLLESADSVTEQIRLSDGQDEPSADADLIGQAMQTFRRSFEPKYGGFGGAPKFPTPHSLLFLLLYGSLHDDAGALEMAEKTLTQMRLGGIFDQIGGGFSRYSTDRQYLVPHFEKMLYDNALLIMAYAAAYHLTQNRLYLQTAEQTAQYVLREMTSPEGGFYSAQDADSEGEEGKFYTFSLSKILDVLGEEQGSRFAECYNITAQGNFEGKNIPNLLQTGHIPEEFADALQTLYDYRKARTALHLDDKILLSWNALMIAALCMLYRVSGDARYLDAAKQAQSFLQGNLSNGVTLCTGYRDGKHTDKAFLDDYAYYTAALIELYHASMEPVYLELAGQFCAEAVRQFSEAEGGFTMSRQGSRELFLNPKETYDGALPSGNAVMAYDLVRLWQITGRERYRELAEQQMQFLAARAQDYPAGHSMFLLAKLLYENPPAHITAAVKEHGDLQRLKLPFLANLRIVSEHPDYPLLHDRTTLYICRDHVCEPPRNL